MINVLIQQILTFYSHLKSYEENPFLLFGSLMMPSFTFNQYIFQVDQGLVDISFH